MSDVAVSETHRRFRLKDLYLLKGYTKSAYEGEEASFRALAVINR